VEPPRGAAFWDGRPIEGLGDNGMEGPAQCFSLLYRHTPLSRLPALRVQGGARSLFAVESSKNPR
jgi:hypothetical protein